MNLSTPPPPPPRRVTTGIDPRGERAASRRRRRQRQLPTPSSPKAAGKEQTASDPPKAGAVTEILNRISSKISTQQKRGGKRRQSSRTPAATGRKEPRLRQSSSRQQQKPKKKPPAPQPTNLSADYGSESELMAGSAVRVSEDEFNPKEEEEEDRSKRKARTLAEAVAYTDAGRLPPSRTSTRRRVRSNSASSVVALFEPDHPSASRKQRRWRSTQRRSESESPTRLRMRPAGLLDGAVPTAAAAPGNDYDDQKKQPRVVQARHRRKRSPSPLLVTVGDEEQERAEPVSEAEAPKVPQSSPPTPTKGRRGRRRESQESAERSSERSPELSSRATDKSTGGGAWSARRQAERERQYRKFRQRQQRQQQLADRDEKMAGVKEGDAAVEQDHPAKWAQHEKITGVDDVLPLFALDSRAAAFLSLYHSDMHLGNEYDDGSGERNNNDVGQSDGDIPRSRSSTSLPSHATASSASHPATDICGLLAHMRAHSNSLPVARLGVDLLRHHVRGSPELARAVGLAGGVQTLLDAVRIHVDDLRVVRGGCEALRAMAAAAHFSAGSTMAAAASGGGRGCDGGTMVERGAVEVLIGAMNAQPSSLGVQAYAILTLELIVRKPPSSRKTSNPNGDSSSKGSGKSSCSGEGKAVGDAARSRFEMCGGMDTIRSALSTYKYGDDVLRAVYQALKGMGYSSSDV